MIKMCEIKDICKSHFLLLRVYILTFNQTYDKKCIHKGKVIFQSSTKDLMCVQDSNGTDAGVINIQDLANAVIIGCTNNIVGIPNPCTKLANIPNSITSSLLEIDNQKIVLAQAISQVITDKGSPLILQGEPKAKDIFEIDERIW